MARDLIDTVISFIFGNKKYELPIEASTFDLIVLPDERVLEVGNWVGNHSLEPQGLVDTNTTRSDFRANGNSVDHLPVAEEVK